MNVQEFMEKLNQREHKLEKRAKLKKLNHFDVKTSKKIKKVRITGKRDWVNAKDEQ